MMAEHLDRHAAARKRGYSVEPHPGLGAIYAKGRARVYPNGPRATQPWVSAAAHGLMFVWQRHHDTLDQALDAADVIYRREVRDAAR